MTIFKKYDGELDNTNPFEYGVNLRKENKSCWDSKYDLSDRFSGGRDDDPTWSFLQNWNKEMIKGWQKQDRIFAKDKYLEQLPSFQNNLPNLGDKVYVENPSNLGNFFLCIIEFIPEERDKVLVRYLERNAPFGQSNLSLCGYSHSSKHDHGIFPRFYKENPEEANK